MAALGEKINSAANNKDLLNVNDVFCYICRSVLIKPVTVPCKHKFCLSCFESSLGETSYSCPLCRKRLSSWIRSAKKDNKLVDSILWTKIQEQYQDEVTSKLSGKDDGLDERLREEYKSPSIIAASGEVGEEFQKIMKSHEEELRLRREKEEMESLLLIKKMHEEEALNRLQAQASLVLQSQKKQSKPTHRSYVNKSKSKSSQKCESGPMDIHVTKSVSVSVVGDKSIEGSDSGQGTAQSSNAHSHSDSHSRSHSSDSIATEFTHFKPIKVQPKTPPKDGSQLQLMVRKITPLKLFGDAHKKSSDRPKEQHLSIHSDYSAFRVLTTLTDEDDTPIKKAKIQDLPENSVLKEISLDENSDSNSNVDGKSIDESGVDKLGAPLMGEENFTGLGELNFVLEEHRKVEEKLKQEKADQELAEKLNKEWNNLGPREYELRNTRNCRPRRCPQRQTTLLEAIVRGKK